MENFFFYLMLIIALLGTSIVSISSIRSINREGFHCGSMFLLILAMFYEYVPLVYLLFPEKANTTTLFNILLASNSNIDIAKCMLLSSILIIMAWGFYKSDEIVRFTFRGREQKLLFYRNSIDIDWGKINKRCSRRIKIWADIIFIAGTISVVACIFAVGGVGNYLALGSRTRGLNKNVTDYISSAFLPFITLSSIILAAPYLYKYLMGCESKNIWLRIKYYSSFTIAVIYLVYNQGRLPVLLFFLPFLMQTRLASKTKIASLAIATFFCIFLLEPLSDLFTYISYGRINTRTATDLTTTLLMDFTYPFTSFLNRGALIESVGMRWGLDYIAWILLIVPSSILGILGLSKTGFSTLQILNTNAYEWIIGLKAGGGIPADFLIFNYFQFGWISLILGLFFVCRFLKSLDSRIQFMNDNDQTKIFSLRMSFLVLSLVNNFDFSVLVKMRADFIIICIVIYYISRSAYDYTID